MKKIFLLFALALLTVSCVDDSSDLPQDFPDSGWLELGSSSAQVFSNVGSISIPIQTGVGNNAMGQTVTYEIKAINGTTLPSGQVSGINTFKLDSGVKSADIVIPIVNDGSSFDIEVNLISTTNGDYKIGLNDGSKKTSHSVSVCGWDPVTWEGTYAIREAFSAGTNAGLSLGAFFGETYQLELSLDASDATLTTFTVVNSAGFNTFLSEPVSIQFDPCSGTATIDPGNPVVALFTNMTVETFVFDGSNFSMQADGPLGPFGPYRFTMIKI